MSTQDLMLLIAAAAGIIISVGFKIIPPLDRWFYSIPDDWRGLSMVGLNLVAALGVFLFSCAGIVASVACTQAGAWELAKAFIVMLGTNQITNLVTQDSKAKKELATQKLLMRANINPQDFQPK